MSARTATNGGLPSKSIDVPVDAVLIAVFLPLAISHMTILQRNRKINHKFIFNGMLFGFGMSRVGANVLRLVWSFRPTNADIALAAGVFVNAGILLAYIINNVLAWRLVRSSIPSFGWSRPVRMLYKIQLWLLLPIIVTLIVLLVISVKAPTPYRSHILTDMLRFAQTYFFVVAVQPVLLIPWAAVVHKQ